MTELYILLGVVILFAPNVCDVVVAFISEKE